MTWKIRTACTKQYLYRKQWRDLNMMPQTVAWENILYESVNLTTYCNVRSGPGTNYSIIGSAYLGDTFTWLDSTTNDKGENMA